ncbi:MAG TPA: protein translocase subunit SecD, partial [Halomonas sp.]|nr:protein translocase subunit SecD [Halomonas sp.]
MLNRYPLWKYLLILIVLLVGLVYSLPNLFPEDPAIQISSERGDATVDERQLERIQSSLADAGIELKDVERSPTSTLLRLGNPDAQLAARDRVAAMLGEEYVVALNLAESTPAWLQALSASPMTLGLDLRGGVHFLLEVDMAAAVAQRLEVNASAMREQLRDERIRYRDTRIDGRTLTLTFTDAEDRNTARSLISREFPDFQYENLGDGRGAALAMTLTDQAV